MAENDQQAAEQAQQQFAIQRIYIKDSSFESPRAPMVFTQKWEPQVQMEINTKTNPVQDDIHEVVLSLTITVKNQNENAYLVEIQQGGIFAIQGFEDDALKQVMGTVCPNILFPYARETVDALVTKGGFPPLHLAPINFDAMYAQALQQQQGNAEQAAAH